MPEKYGFVYLWFDRKHRRFYVGCHWGDIDDGYVCSSRWMKQAYGNRPKDFKRRILKTNIKTRQEMFIEEVRVLAMIKPEEIKKKYYNLNIRDNNLWHSNAETRKTIGAKISASKKGISTGPCSPEKAAKISASKKGTKFSPEHIENIRLAKLGDRMYNDGIKNYKVKQGQTPDPSWIPGMTTRKKV